MSDLPPYRLGDAELDVYPVGFAADLRHVWRTLLGAGPGPALYAARRRLPYLLTNGRRRSYWNGYLAEPYAWPDGLTNCGHGWTPHRAVRSLNRYTAQEGSTP